MLRNFFGKICIICVFMGMQMVIAKHLTADEGETTTVRGALLQTQINAMALESPQPASEKIIPRTQMKLSAIVKNVGDVPSASGQVFLQFALPKPLGTKPESVIFKTEKITLPSIEPGSYIAFNFSTPHQWPSMFDFIRKDWAMREYQAVVDIAGTENVTGTRVISFSAYYYEGRISETPVRVSSADYISAGDQYGTVE